MIVSLFTVIVVKIARIITYGGVLAVTNALFVDKESAHPLSLRRGYLNFFNIVERGARNLESNVSVNSRRYHPLRATPGKFLKVVKSPPPGRFFAVKSRGGGGLPWEPLF